MNFSPVGEPQSTPHSKWEPHAEHMYFRCALVCMTNDDNIKSLFSSFQFFLSFFFFYLAECLFCYLQELLILLTAEQKSKSESKQLVMSFQWPISMKLRAKTSRLRQCQPSEFISEGELCWGEGAEEELRFLGSSRGPSAFIKKWWQQGTHHQTYLPPTSTVAGLYLTGEWRREKSPIRKNSFHLIAMPLTPIPALSMDSQRRKCSFVPQDATNIPPRNTHTSLNLLWWFRQNGATFSFWVVTLIHSILFKFLRCTHFLRIPYDFTSKNTL